LGLASQITATTAREHAEKYREKTRHMDLVMRKADKKAHLVGWSMYLLDG
jgi:hypothetical protein